jgi:hypothetical protein
MIATFTALLFAHVLADFVLQSRWMVAAKRQPAVLLLHGVIVLLTLIISLGNFGAWQVFALAAAHIVIDAIKIYGWRGTGLWLFLADQAAHLATLVATAVLFPGLWAAGDGAAWPWIPGVMALLSGLVLATRAGGFAIGFLMTPWSGHDLPQGLENGGMLIGILERGLIFLLVMVGQPAGIGFLIAAKSVLRFDTTSKDQRAGEYVIIGTLASFGWALICAYGTVALLSHLPALGILPLNN